VAGELMRRLEDSAALASARFIWLHVDLENTAAARLYERDGFVLNGKAEKYYPRGRDALIYKKLLE
jgi:ribosomal protein S18 acetylase RimI-like enzyme